MLVSYKVMYYVSNCRPQTTENPPSITTTKDQCLYYPVCKVSEFTNARQLIFCYYYYFFFISSSTCLWNWYSQRSDQGTVKLHCTVPVYQKLATLHRGKVNANKIMEMFFACIYISFYWPSVKLLDIPQWGIDSHCIHVCLSVPRRTLLSECLKKNVYSWRIQLILITIRIIRHSRLNNFLKAIVILSDWLLWKLPFRLKRITLFLNAWIICCLLL